MHTMNEAFIKKLGWGLVNDYNSFWVSILRGKYASCNEGEGPLFLIGLQVIDPEDLSRVVGDCFYSKGQWNYSRCVHMLPVHIITKIASIRRPPLELGADSFFLAFRSFR